MALRDSTKTAICFLLIGRLGELSRISIQSALDRTSSPIFVGILDDRDTQGLPKSSRINFIKLNLNSGDTTSGMAGQYQDFSTESFYQIVQYKWQLLLRIMELEYEFVIYSDTDVYWNLNPIPLLEKVFLIRPSLQMQIQSFTDDPSEPKLCMGFVAFRVSPKTIQFLGECFNRHQIESSTKKKVGDDDIVTLKFVEDGFPATILELPQTTFPVGRMLKFYRTKSIMPGLGSPEPYIFHANYVVGLTNKLIMTKLFIRHYSSSERGQRLGFSLYSQLAIKRLRQSLHDFRVKVLKITNAN